jgi:hypothetical protein
MRRSLRPLSLAGFVGLSTTLASCATAPPSREDVASVSAAITRDTILANAQQGVTAKLLYCQAPNHAADGVREDNPVWDPYRSDCSGFVSWSWGLPAPGRDTSEFAPADTTVSFAIDGADLQPGDALNIPGDHIILFTGWATVGSVANFYEEPGCSATPPYAHAFTSDVTITGSSVDVSYEGKTFTAIRFTGITTDGDAATEVGADAGGTSSTDCYSDTLGATVPENTCVQSSSDGNWYQCDDGSWVVRSTDPTACVAQYPLGSSIDGGTDGGPTSAPDATTHVDATTDPDASGVDASDAGSTRSDATTDATTDATASADSSAQGTNGATGMTGSGCSFSRKKQASNRDLPWIAFGVAGAFVSLSRRRSR